MRDMHSRKTVVVKHARYHATNCCDGKFVSFLQIQSKKSTAQIKNQKDAVDHQINLCHTGIVLQPFSNRTNANISELVAPLHHTPLHAPPAPVLLGTLSCTLHWFMPHFAHFTHPFRILRHAPTYHYDLFQALESTKIRTQRLDIVIPQLLC